MSTEPDAPDDLRALASQLVKIKLEDFVLITPQGMITSHNMGEGMALILALSLYEVCNFSPALAKTMVDKAIDKFQNERERRLAREKTH